MRTLTHRPKATQDTTAARSSRPDQARLGNPASWADRSPHGTGLCAEVKGRGRLRRAREAWVDAGSTSIAPRGLGHDFGRVAVHAPATGDVRPMTWANAPGDEYEQEVNRVAEAVLRAPDRGASPVASGGDGSSPAPSSRASGGRGRRSVGRRSKARRTCCPRSGRWPRRAAGGCGIRKPDHAAHRGYLCSTPPSWS